jgi:putative nucleotidyltransferase with HDIG domain
MWGRASLRRLPYVAGATALVTGMPAAVAVFLVPSGSTLELLAGIVVALVLSMGAARLGAALWMRHPLAREVLFADLMAWEWFRRLWVERRIARAQSAIGTDHLAPQARAEALRDLARLLEARDAYTHGHSQRVARHALRIAHALHVPTAEAQRIWLAATLHDVGKLYTPREVLNKPGRLTDDEFEVIKRHPVDGADMLADVDGDPQIIAIVRSHHERLDGRGYPDGLAGEEIPLGARVIAVADTFDALTSTRSYRPASSHKRALDILREEAGAQLDGAAVAAFVRTYSGRRPAAVSSLVALAPQRALAWAGHQAGAVAGLAPATAWIAPLAAAAAAAVGASHGADRATTDPPGRAAKTTAAVRAPLPARAASLVPSAAVTARPKGAKAPARPHARRPMAKRPHGAPATPPQSTATTAPQQQSIATTTGADEKTPSSPPSNGLPSATVAAPSVRDLVAAVKLPAPPPSPVPVVQDVVATTNGAVTAVTEQVTTTVDTTVDDVTALLAPK